MAEINDFVMNNLIYSEETRGFVPRLWDKWKRKMPASKNDAQHDAWAVVSDMNEADALLAKEKKE